MDKADKSPSEKGRKINPLGLNTNHDLLNSIHTWYGITVFPKKNMWSHKETACFPYQNSYFRRSREIHTLPPEIRSLYYILLDDQRPAVGIVAAAVLNILQFVVHLQAALARFVTELPFATRFLVVDIADRRDHRSRSRRRRTPRTSRARRPQRDVLRPSSPYPSPTAADSCW